MSVEERLKVNLLLLLKERQEHRVFQRAGIETILPSDSLMICHATNRKVNIFLFDSNLVCPAHIINLQDSQTAATERSRMLKNRNDLRRAPA